MMTVSLCVSGSYKSLYEDVMMENHQTTTSLDGSSNGNTPEICSHPVNSQDCTEENHRITQEYQGEDLTNIKVEDTEGEEETYVRGDQQCKEEETPTDISTDGFSNLNTPERCPRPIFSQDYTEENHRITEEYQVGDLTHIKIEYIDGEQEMCVVENQQCKKEEIPTYTSTGKEATLQHGRLKTHRQHESRATQPSTASQPGHLSQLATPPTAASQPGTSSQPFGKRRRPNFSYHEVDILVNNVVDILFAASKNLTASGKLAVWQQITQKVNAVAPIIRSVEEVKKRWQDFKRRLKDKLREYHRHARETGREPCSQLQLTTLEQRAMTCIQPEQIHGLHIVDTDRPISYQQHTAPEDVEEQPQSSPSPRLDPQSPSPPLPESPAPTPVEISPQPQILQQPDKEPVLEYHDHLMEIQRQQLSLQERQAEALEGVGATLSRLATAQERLASAQERQNIIMEKMVSVLQRVTSQSMPTLYGLGGASAAAVWTLDIIFMIFPVTFLVSMAHSLHRR
ncbi:uncharacterized protein LOC142159857 isoform X5 [Mixophyes fleayi]|uniref:uncharacterized protein LOC142159857 isoform X5 n=1 Tax=Mixophyes fleayi TaxID=3061075 RepID=UPI003F4DAD03